MTGTQATEAARHLTPAVLDALSTLARDYSIGTWDVRGGGLDYYLRHRLCSGPTVRTWGEEPTMADLLDAMAEHMATEHGLLPDDDGCMPDQEVNLDLPNVIQSLGGQQVTIVADYGQDGGRAHAHLYREPGAVLLQHRGHYGIYK